MRDINEKGTLSTDQIRRARFSYYAETGNFLPFTPEGSERSGRIVVGSSATTGIATVCGITSFTDLSFKSTVSVSYGSTQTFHQIYVLSDPNKVDTFLSQGPIAAVGTTTGIGTFGAEFSGNNVNLEFYPDSGVTGIVSIFSYLSRQ